MTSLKTEAVSMNGVSLSLGECVAYLKRRGRLVPELRAALLDQLIRVRACEAGVIVSESELQAAADAFRRRHGMASAADTSGWLARECLTAEDLEHSLESDLLAEKFKDHLTRDRIAGHFAGHRDGYARARLRLILVAREDLARELLSQIRDDGRDFAELAGAHSLHPSRSDGGRLGMLLRRQLPKAIADAVFGAPEGAAVGPFAGAPGFQLLLVEALVPAVLDADVTALIRQELFDAWLRGQLEGLKFPLLEAL